MGGGDDREYTYRNIVELKEAMQRPLWRAVLLILLFVTVAIVAGFAYTIYYVSPKEECPVGFGLCETVDDCPRFGHGSNARCEYGMCFVYAEADTELDWDGEGDVLCLARAGEFGGCVASTPHVANGRLVGCAYAFVSALRHLSGTLHGVPLAEVHTGRHATRA